MIPDSSALYFAYGSNLLPTRLRQVDRCPNAKLVCVARLDDHRLGFEKRSNVDGSGKCTITATKESSARDGEPPGSSSPAVHGALYQITAQERAALDRVEGVGNGYQVEHFEVRTEAGARHAFAYVAHPDWYEPGLSPLSWYRDLVLHGALLHGFPGPLINQLRATTVLADSDRVREARERRALAQSPLPA